MKMNLELIRRMVLTVREAEWPLTQLEGVEPRVFVEHARLVVEGGLAEGTFLGGRPGAAALKRLTWTGQQFASHIEKDTVWHSITTFVVSKGIPWTASLLVGVAKAKCIEWGESNR